MTRKITFFISVLLVAQACIKDNNVPDPNIKGNFSGKIILPSNTNQNVDQLNVDDGFDIVPIKDGEYSIPKHGQEFSYQFVSNTNEDVILLGYNYPGQQNFDISVKSTALGLFMMLPVIQSLSKEGKLNTIEFVLKSPYFAQLTDIISNYHKKGMFLYEPSNTEMVSVLGLLLKSTPQRISADEIIPVNTYRAGNELTFVNNTRYHKTVIGIYKDGQAQRYKESDFLIIDESNFLPSSLSDIIATTANPASDPEYKYTMIGDGKYEFKYRTGLPGLGDSSRESYRAGFQNLMDHAIKLITSLVGERLPNGCRSSFIDIVMTKSMLVWEASKNKEVETAQAIIDVITGVFLDDTQLSRLASCVKPDGPIPQYKFLKKIGKAIGFYSLVGSTMDSFNALFFAAHWSTSLASYDACYLIKNGIVTTCDDSLKDYVLSGGVSQTAQIGADDDFEIYINDTLAFSNMDGTSNGSDPFKFKAKKGDSIRIVGYNTIPPCAILSPFYLHQGSSFQILTEGYPQNCGVPIGKFFDKTFIIGL